MDSSERLVETYLKGLAFKEVRYEPDGNVPPDFLCDGRVAVEVRRLNQNHDDGTGRGLRGLEEVAIPLWRRVRDYLTGLGAAPASDQSWYVFYRFGRPLPDWKTIKRELDALLVPFMAHPDPQPFEAELTGGFSIKVFRAPTPKPSFFRPSGHSDEQSGGWLIAEIESNLAHCIAEKTGKIAPYRARYPEWWLVLPDQIGYGLDDFEQELFFDQASITPGSFDKIVLLDPRDVGRVFEVWP
ncbi:hypothetical protein GCM10022281_24230 [Sphingomonas rosea]|uniref:Uncharacterized protein n=1 Tax=Sphingomonas rosea TaxID=335605 RepID=A0ABP7UG33_9SPHN